MTDVRRIRIAVIPGDGIGKEVIPEGLRILDRVAEQTEGGLRFEYEHFPWGCQYYLETGRMLDPDAPGVPDHISLWGLRLAICQGFDQYANIRPVRLLPGVPSPLKNGTAETLDWVVVRENTEGEYAGIGGRNLASRGPGKAIAIQAGLFTEEGCERIIRFAFDLALTRKRHKVTSVTKSNAQQYGMTLWDEVFSRVASDYPGVETEQWLVDAMAARFVLKPETLEVVVASNLFADILSDLGSALAGSLGIAASANLNPDGRFPSMFEPVHGSAPDIAGQGIANPIGAIWSAALMLDHLGLPGAAAQIMHAIEGTTAAGILTPDLGGQATTTQVTDAVLASL
jgi:tartrate dehydrogenase/decarboxylase / D-malate dehydrogenase